jgi:hypothetical protein
MVRSTRNLEIPGSMLNHAETATSAKHGFVMAGLVPAIHVLRYGKVKDVDAWGQARA